jgi:phosphoesterase RecJ-like protein
MSNSLSSLKKLLNNPKKISIVIHRNPDGDALGSGLALYEFLKKKGHEVSLISPNEIPNYLKWLPGIDQVLVFDDAKDQIKDILKHSDIIFTLDFNDLSRAGKDLGAYLETLQDIPFVMIDHHLEPADYATYKFSDPSKSSTSEMIYDFIVSLDGKDLIDKDMATNLYTGIMTDTGSFKFPNTTPHTMCIAADLMKKGINHNQIQINIYDSFSLDKLHLLGEALNKLVFLPQYKTAYIALSKDDLKKYHYQKGDTEGFVNYGLALKDADFAIMFIENDDEGVRISFRSKGKFPANEFAKQFFNGGGHLNAAGGRTTTSLDETVQLFLEKLPEFYKKWQQSNES